MTVGRIGDFDVDVFTSEEHSFDADVTQHPVEVGANVSDNVRAKPGVITIEGVVSDTPIGALKSARSANPSDDFRDYLEDIRRNAEPIFVATSRRDYDDMVLQNFSESVKGQDEDAIRFKCTFTQIQFVVTARAVVRVSLPRAKKKVDKGVVAAKPSPPGPPPHERSKVYAGIAKRLANHEGAASFDSLLAPFKGVF